jgi:uncharacterized cupredoxin-like copper-binding protein
MIRVVRSHRLVVAVAAVVCVLLAGGAAAVAGAGDGTPRVRVFGPGSVTVRLDVEHSRFHPALVYVRPHTDVRFVVVNHDPIGHEFIIGGPEVHTRHANGKEAVHPPVPGEVSVPPGETAATTYAFHAPGTVVYACHLPGHFQYGMKGKVVVETS